MNRPESSHRGPSVALFADIQLLFSNQELKISSAATHSTAQSGDDEIGDRMEEDIKINTRIKTDPRWETFMFEEPFQSLYKGGDWSKQEQRYLAN